MHGASELAHQCLAGLADYAAGSNFKDAAAFRHSLIELARRLQQTRPSMAMLTNLIERWLNAFEKGAVGQLDEIRAQAVVLAQALIAESRQAVEKAASHAGGIIGSGKTIITHSLSSTVVAAFTLLAPQVKAIITESRPPGEGRRLAQTLSRLGIATDFISDQQMGLFVQDADVALVGADTVTLDGSVVNKAGTYLLALAARERRIPFYACFESFKCSRLGPEDIRLERHDPEELDPPKLEHVETHNVYFDITPPRLVSAWITERGVARERRDIANERA